MAGALGAASCAFVGSGLMDSFHQISRFVGLSQSYYPDPSLKAIYEELFESYKQVYHGLKKAYIRANLDRFNRND
jgi:sugar (pentulose or hexulose) kinase